MNHFQLSNDPPALNENNTNQYCKYDERLNSLQVPVSTSLLSHNYTNEGHHCWIKAALDGEKNTV